jgi:molybdopterin converting factor small subunit
MKIGIDLAHILAKAAGKSEFDLDFPGRSSMTLEELLGELVSEYPKLKDEIYDEKEDLSFHILIFINDRPMQHSDKITMELNDGDVVHLYPVIGGG